MVWTACDRNSNWLNRRSFSFAILMCLQAHSFGFGIKNIEKYKLKKKEKKKTVQCVCNIKQTSIETVTYVCFWSNTYMCYSHVIIVNCALATTFQSYTCQIEYIFELMWRKREIVFFFLFILCDSKWMNMW